MSAHQEEKSGHWCFFSRSQSWPKGTEAPPVRLQGSHAQALARLIPLLGCGEEAAGLAFEGLAKTVKRGDATAWALDQIAREEQDHGVWMHMLASALPPVADQAALLRTARKFHINLGSGGADLHLARIAALDSAVCTILSRLLCKGAPLSDDQNVHNILSRIQRDEARHVALSRTLALASANLDRARDVGAAAREALAKIMMQVGDAFEILGVDPQSLHKDLSRLPNGLLAA